jgi:type III restriction enzyme
METWKRNKIYADFIAADKRENNTDNYGTVYALEIKGIHLKNEDTKYKQDVVALCNELGAKKTGKELFDKFPHHGFEFQVIFEDEWQNKINQLI